MTAPDTLAPLTGSAPATTGEEFRALVRLAGPLVGANLLQMAVAAVDVIFVARLGTVELAAATLGVFLFNVLMYATIGLTTAAALPRNLARQSIKWPAMSWGSVKTFRSPTMAANCARSISVIDRFRIKLTRLRADYG